MIRFAAALLIAPLAGGCDVMQAEVEALERVEAQAEAALVDFAGRRLRHLPGTLHWRPAPHGEGVVAHLADHAALQQLMGLDLHTRGTAAGEGVVIHVSLAESGSSKFLHDARRRFSGRYVHDLEVHRRLTGETTADDLKLPAPYDGWISCPAAAHERPGTLCYAEVRREGLNHRFAVPADAVQHWRAHVDGYFGLFDRLSA